MGTINLVGSLRYDMHGRKRKTNSLKVRSSSRSRTVDCLSINKGSNPLRTARDRNIEALTELKQRMAQAKPYEPDPERAAFEAEKREISKQYTLAPAYNKGAYQVIPKSDLKHIGK